MDDICYYVYDFRTKAKENFWKYLFERHERCEYEIREIARSEPKKYFARFLCFNCLNKDCCQSWKEMSEEDFQRYNRGSGNWKSVRLKD